MSDTYKLTQVTNGSEFDFLLSVIESYDSDSSGYYRQDYTKITSSYGVPANHLFYMPKGNYQVTNFPVDELVDQNGNPLQFTELGGVITSLDFIDVRIYENTATLVKSAVLSFNTNTRYYAHLLDAMSPIEWVDVESLPQPDSSDSPNQMYNYIISATEPSTDNYTLWFDTSRLESDGIVYMWYNNNGVWAVTNHATLMSNTVYDTSSFGGDIFKLVDDTAAAIALVINSFTTHYDTATEPDITVPHLSADQKAAFDALKTYEQVDAEFSDTSSLYNDVLSGLTTYVGTQMNAEVNEYSTQFTNFYPAMANHLATHLTLEQVNQVAGAATGNHRHDLDGNVTVSMDRLEGNVPDIYIEQRNDIIEEAINNYSDLYINDDTMQYARAQIKKVTYLEEIDTLPESMKVPGNLVYVSSLGEWYIYTDNLKFRQGLETKFVANSYTAYGSSYENIDYNMIYETPDRILLSLSKYSSSTGMIVAFDHDLVQTGYETISAGSYAAQISIVQYNSSNLSEVNAILGNSSHYIYNYRRSTDTLWSSIGYIPIATARQQIGDSIHHDGSVILIPGFVYTSYSRYNSTTTMGILYSATPSVMNSYTLVHPIQHYYYNENGIGTQATIHRIFDKFVVFLNNNKTDTGQFLYSTDGITWTQGSLPGYIARVGGVAIGPDKVIAVGFFDADITSTTPQYNAMTTLDGITWEMYNIPNYDVSLQSLTYSAVTTYWTSANIAYGNGKYLATPSLLSDSSPLLYSEDGNTWKSLGTIPVEYLTKRTLYSPTYLTSRGTFIGITDKGLYEIGIGVNNYSWTKFSFGSANIPFKKYKIYNSAIYNVLSPSLAAPSLQLIDSSYGVEYPQFTPNTLSGSVQVTIQVSKNLTGGGTEAYPMIDPTSLVDIRFKNGFNYYVASAVLSSKAILGQFCIKNIPTDISAYFNSQYVEDSLNPKWESDGIGRSVIVNTSAVDESIFNTSYTIGENIVNVDLRWNSSKGLYFYQPFEDQNEHITDVLTSLNSEEARTQMANITTKYEELFSSSDVYSVRSDLPYSLTTYPWRTVTYGNGLFIANVSGNLDTLTDTAYIATSTNGKDWTVFEDTTKFTINANLGFDGTYITATGSAVSTSNTIDHSFKASYSTNGASWTRKIFCGGTRYTSVDSAVNFKDFTIAPIKRLDASTLSIFTRQYVMYDDISLSSQSADVPYIIYDIPTNSSATSFIITKLHENLALIDYRISGYFEPVRYTTNGHKFEEVSWTFENSDIYPVNTNANNFIHRMPLVTYLDGVYYMLKSVNSSSNPSMVVYKSTDFSNWTIAYGPIMNKSCGFIFTLNEALIIFSSITNSTTTPITMMVSLDGAVTWTEYTGSEFIPSPLFNWPFIISDIEVANNRVVILTNYGAFVLVV